MSQQPSERVGVLATIDPDVYTANTYTSDWCDMTLFNSVLAVGFAGTLGSSATLIFSVLQATDSSGTDSKAITSKTATTLTQAGTDSDKQVLINIRSDDLDISGGFTHVALQAIVGTATSDMGGVVLGLDPDYGSAAANDLASVDEIIA